MAYKCFETHKKREENHYTNPRIPRNFNNSHSEYGLELVATALLLAD